MTRTRSPKPLPIARAVALEALFRCLEQGQDVQAALDTALTDHSPEQRDAALATELTYGYLRLKGRLDYVLSRFIKDPSHLPPKMALALGVAAYEILSLDRVPAYASVDWAVDFAKTKPGARLSGLFNAVLRRVSELGDTALDPDFYARDAGKTEFLSRVYACPEWLVTLWIAAYGEENALKYLEAQCQPPALGVNLFRHPDADQLYGDLAGHEDLMDVEGMCFALPSGASLPRVDTPIHRQSFAARQALEQLRPETWDTPVWDACAGRGGKTRVLLEKGIPVFASDVHKGRLAALRRELPDVKAFEAPADSAEPPEVPGTILLDLPCSGLGVLSRRPDAKWKRTPADLAKLAQLQRDILDNAATRVRPGGMIAIITCTLNPDENETQVQRFLADNPGAAMEIQWTTPADSALNEFFYAALIRMPK